MIYGIRRMIYLLRKHDIISVPSYAEGIYHRSKSDITSKIYHPFRKERISLKNDKFLLKLVVFHGGTGQICLHFCRRQKLRFASVQPSAATVPRTVAFRSSNLSVLFFSKTKRTPYGVRFVLEVPARFELANNGFADRGLTTWLRYHMKLGTQRVPNFWSG